MKKERVAILTTFRHFIPGYSLTSIVLDQYELLKRNGHEVDIFVPENYHGRLDPPGIPTVVKKMPMAKLVDYKSKNDVSEDHKAVIAKMATLCTEVLSTYDVVITHDLIFTGWNVPYGQGIRVAAEDIKETRWLHWVHSIPSGFRDFWYLREYGTRHRVVYPNRTDARRVIEQFRDELERIRVIPHPVDLRSKLDFSQDAREFIDDFPRVMEADVVQIYPASTDRLAAKGVRDLILIFKGIKELGYSVCLVIANQHATGRGREEDLTRYTKIAHRNGLPSDEVIFTSNWRPEVKEGIPKRMLMDLFHCSNLFVFPTNHETFGLVLPEACLCGGVLPVLNKSLGMMGEISGMNADYIDFGAFNVASQRPDHFHEQVARSTIGRLLRNESIMTKTYMRQRYNWDNLYRKFYNPIFAESVHW